jgi:hypothetical protein
MNILAPRNLGIITLRYVSNEHGENNFQTIDHNCKALLCGMNPLNITITLDYPGIEIPQKINAGLENLEDKIYYPYPSFKIFSCFELNAKDFVLEGEISENINNTIENWTFIGRFKGRIPREIQYWSCPE